MNQDSAGQTPPVSFEKQGPPPTPIDGYSIAAFVSALTCCAAPLGVALGIVGLFRTSKGVRRGRGLAVAGLLLGSLISLAMMAALIFGIVKFVETSADDLDYGDARAGQCIDLDWADYPNLVPCDGPHEAEIVWAGEVTTEVKAAWDETRYLDDFCLTLDLSEVHDRAVRAPNLGLGYSVDTFWGEPKIGAKMICYVTSKGGDLTKPLSEYSN